MTACDPADRDSIAAPKPRQRAAVRAGAALAAAASMAVHYMALHAGTEPPTTLRLAVSVLALACALALALAALAPSFLIDRCWRCGIAALRWTDESELFQSGRWGIGLLVIGWASYLTLLSVYLSTPNDPNVGDQGTYLETARWINSHGGWAALPANMVSGRYPEANRHPLFIALVSLVPGFTAGRMLSAGFGVATLALMGGVVARRYGLLTAGIVTVLLGTNKLFLLSTSRVVCESVLVLLCAWLWWRTVEQREVRPGERASGLEAVRDGAGNAGAASRSLTFKTVLFAAELGAVAGLVWLTKGTGLPILLGLVSWWIWRAWPRRSRVALGAGIIVGAFALTSGLLIARNVVRFGEPFYNVNTLLLFSDRYEQMDQMIARGTTPRQAAAQYLATHSVVELGQRAVSGLVWEAFILLRSLGPAPWGDGRVFWGALLGGAAAGVLLLRREFRRSVLLAWLVILVPMFGWYVPIAAGDRFVVPLIPGLLTSGAVAMGLICRRLQSWRGEKAGCRVVGLGVLLWSAAAVAATIAWGPNEFAPG